MPKLRTFVSTLTLGAALTGGMVGLSAAATTTSAQAATVVKAASGDYRDNPSWARNRNWNRNWNRNRNRNRNRSLASTWARNWASTWARNWARNWTRSHNTNRQAQSINIRLVFPDQLGAPVTASATTSAPKS